ncbi:MAG TPA: YicC/YloC family endoribonuclease [Myxococcota bacterium]
MTSTVFSMTGFGRGRQDLAEPGSAVVVELKSVNHKGLEVKLRLPRALHADEVALGKQLRARFERGRIDASIDVVTAKVAAPVAVDEARVAAVMALVSSLSSQHPAVTPTITAGELLRLPGILVEQAGDVDDAADAAALSAAAVAAVDEAIAALIASRAAEGAGLRAVVVGHRDRIASLTEEIAGRMDAVVADKRQKLQDKLDALLGEHLEPSRVVAEVSVLAERLDVGEEIARLRLHLEQLDALVSSSTNGCGRRLDFLCQELLREANTTASKCQDANVAHLVVELKAEIERLREQAQNVE